jgi:hypothetical protein
MIVFKAEDTVFKSRIKIYLVEDANRVIERTNIRISIFFIEINQHLLRNDFIYITSANTN